MPNYCTNKLKVTGEPDDLKTFYNENKGHDYDLSFAKSVPDEDWGCKWDADEVLFSDNDDFLYYTFDTPWNHPYNWLDVVGKKYKNLKFKLTAYEPMMDFYVKLIYENGEITTNIEKEYSEHRYMKNKGDLVCEQIFTYMKDKPDVKQKIIIENYSLDDVADEYEEFADIVFEFIDDNTLFHLKKPLCHKYYLQEKYFNKWKKITDIHKKETEQNKVFYELTVHEFKLCLRSINKSCN